MRAQLRALSRALAGGLGVGLTAALLAALGLWHALAPWAPLQRLDWLLDDWRVAALAEQTSAQHPDIVIVDLDDRSLQVLGRWPWPRERVAALSTELLQRQRVAALGFDLVFAEPDTGAFDAVQTAIARDADLAPLLPRLRSALNQDERLAQALQGQPVVLGWYLSSDRGGSRSGPLPAPVASVPAGQATPTWPRWSGWASNVPLLQRAAPRAGYFNAQVDADGVVRSVPGLARVDDALFEPLALALWRQATASPPPTLNWRAVQGGATVQSLQWEATAAGRLRVALQADGSLRVPYTGRGGPSQGRFRYVSALDVLAHRLAPGELQGRLVLVGSSAPGLGDLRSTPIHPAMPGVEVHAHLLAGLLGGTLPQRPDWAPAFEVVQLLLVLAAVSALALRRHAPLAIGGAAALMGALVALNVWWLWHHHWVLPLASALLLGAGQFVLVVSGNQWREWRRRRAVEALFSAYLPPTRVRQLVHTPAAQRDITAENRELSVLFCDLQGFSGLAETLSPEALRELLNRFFSESTAIIQAHDGTLDKFIGDAVMAFWGAPLPQPDHAVRAVRAALALADDIGPMNQWLTAHGLPSIRYGIGLATGLVCVGDLGSARRRSYTAVGDAVNLAARLEALTRELGVGLLVDHSTQRQVEALWPELVWLEVDECQVKGRAQFVTVFTPLASVHRSDPLMAHWVCNWHLALQAVRRHDLVSAQDALERLSEHIAKHPTTVPDFMPHLAARLRRQWLQAAPGAAA